jgi:uncharacterized membrane protein
LTLSPIVAAHVATGAVALASGAAAFSFRKGSRPHRLAGTAFIASMLAMAASGAWIAFSMRVMLSVVGGLLTLYLVLTAWAAVARSGRRSPVAEAGLLLLGVFVAGLSLVSGFEALGSETGLKDGYPPGQYFMFGTVAFLGAAGDLKRVAFGASTGFGRIARHLWRMCAAFLIASSAFFMGQAHLFPAAIRESQLLFVPVLLPFLLMLYWLVRGALSRGDREEGSAGTRGRPGRGGGRNERPTADRITRTVR